MALSGSLTPGSSTIILPGIFVFWIFGWVTPKRSILLLKISNELSIASVTSELITLITSVLFLPLTFSLRVLVPKITDNSVPSGLNSFANSSTNPVWLFSMFFTAFWRDFLKVVSLLLPDKETKISFTETSKVTLIPPFKSRPKLISLDLHSW